MISRSPFAGFVDSVGMLIAFVAITSQPARWARILGEGATEADDFVVLGWVVGFIFIRWLINSFMEPRYWPADQDPAPSKPDPEGELYRALVALRLEREGEVSGISGRIHRQRGGGSEGGREGKPEGPFSRDEMP